MRNPNRIPDVLDALHAYWTQHTDLRFGQVVLAAAQEKGCDDAFYIEDAEIVDALRNSAPVTVDATGAPRISAVLDALRVYWTANSDLRLGQIMENAASHSGRRSGCFGLEDDEVLDTLTFYTFHRR